MPSWFFHWTFLATITVYPSLTFKTVRDVNSRDKKRGQSDWLALRGLFIFTFCKSPLIRLIIVLDLASRHISNLFFFTDLAKYEKGTVSGKQKIGCRKGKKSAVFALRNPDLRCTSGHCRGVTRIKITARVETFGLCWAQFYNRTLWIYDMYLI